eukprot:CAMPEP_0118925080 /NCGR_PEP_ID=MMETSP1169-20130426/3004_1 /TAXON_ID=36882 /ORGANISM="Pyramimonas obovata, Strain CCMP722" /LENGTH=137 /DNA_ID=CAMNT_0006866279 /DNA_START=137 /DNA_END=550 /DNA_ORIENTATION=-
MCAGLAALCGPPSLVLACYGTWLGGQSAAMSTLELQTPLKSSFAAYAAGAAGMAASWKCQSKIIFPLFEEGGAMSLEQASQKLGEPLRISTWRDFYRCTGPPVFARVGGVVTSFFIAGASQALVASYLEKNSESRKQ